MFLDFRTPAHYLFQTLSLSLTLTLCVCLVPLLKKPAVRAHVIEKCTFGILESFPFLLICVYGLSVRFFMRDTWGVRVAAISPRSLLRWRDVVTMECSIACQWRHSGWTEWSNGDEENRRGRGKMIGPCVDSQYSFTMAHSTHNMNFNKLWNLLKKNNYQSSSSPCQYNMSRNYTQTHTNTICYWAKHTLHIPLQHSALYAVCIRTTPTSTSSAKVLGICGHGCINNFLSHTWKITHAGLNQ